MARRDFDLVNAGINRFRYEQDKWHLEVWGDAGHLNAELTTVT
jgi:hypothetical protein